MTPKKTTVIVVDDSAFIRQVFTNILSSAPDIEVIDTAADPYEAREKIKQHNPDVITLDIEMPKMDGISFLEKIMKLRPMPVIMVSTLTQKGSEETLRALELGAIDYIAKPTEGLAAIKDLEHELIEKVRTAARAKILSRAGAATPTTGGPTTLKLSKESSVSVIAIGSSTGGVEALREVIPLMPENSPPIVITQHMPEQFTHAFANRLNKLSAITVHEAQQNQPLLKGNAYLAPGGQHLEISPVSTGFKCILTNKEKVSGHKPSVDVLFSSVATHAGRQTIGVILTGMGRDGAIGLLQMRESGAHTLGQNEETCVVYGMPKAARLNGGVEREVPISHMAAEILKLCER